MGGKNERDRNRRKRNMAEARQKVRELEEQIEQTRDGAEKEELEKQWTEALRGASRKANHL